MREPERIETVIVGGGQAGLAVGYHLARRGRPFVILDANDQRRRLLAEAVGLAPRVHPGPPRRAAGHAVPRAGPLASPPRTRWPTTWRPTRSDFSSPVRTGVRVEGLSRVGNRFVLTSGDRRFEADNVVVAAGAYHSPRVPAFAAELDPGILQMHSSDYRNPSQLREGDVLVIGAGNSGAEIALEASRGHRTWLSGRDTGHEPARPGSGMDRLVTPLFWFMVMHVLTVKTPLGRKARRTFRSKGIPLVRVWREDLTAAGVELVPRTASVRDGVPVAGGRTGPRRRERGLVHGIRAGLHVDRSSGLQRGGRSCARARGRGFRARPVLHRALLPVRVRLGADRGGRQGRRAHRQAHRGAGAGRPARAPGPGGRREPSLLRRFDPAGFEAETRHDAQIAVTSLDGNRLGMPSGGGGSHDRRLTARPAAPTSSHSAVGSLSLRS